MSSKPVLEKTVLLAFILVTSVAASTAANKTEDCSSLKELEGNPDWTDYDQLLQSELRFTAQLCRRIAVRRSSDDVNVVFTPFNIYNSLLVLYFMAANETEATIRQLFNIPQNQTKNVVHAIYNTLNLHKKVTVTNKLKIVCPEKKKKQYIQEDFRIFLSEDIKPKSCARNFYNRHITPVDFTKHEETLEKVNSWATNQTGHNDSDIVKEGDFDNLSTMLVANVAVFHGIWKHPFTHVKHNQEFQMSNGTKLNVTLMVQTGKFKTWADDTLGANILEVPYKGNMYKLLILLPQTNKREAIYETLSNLQEKSLNNIITMLSSVNESTVQVEIPKFTFEKTYNLIKTMKYLGYDKIFSAPLDFTNILEESSGLDKITKYRVKAVYSVKIQFDEYNTKLSTIPTSSYPDDEKEKTKQVPGVPVFRADHPFIYFVYTKTNLISLGGMFYHP